jgi:hypothetical protein
VPAGVEFIKKNGGIVELSKGLYGVSKMTNLFGKSLGAVISFDHKNKKKGTKFLIFLNNTIFYIVGLAILIQVIVGSVSKHGDVKTSTTTNDRENIQSFSFTGNEFKQYFVAQLVQTPDGKIDAFTEDYFTTISSTPTLAKDGTGLKYTIEDYQRAFCANIYYGIVT